MSIGVIAALTYIGCIIGIVVGLFIFAICGIYMLFDLIKEYLRNR